MRVERKVAGGFLLTAVIVLVAGGLATALYALSTSTPAETAALSDTVAKDEGAKTNDGAVLMAQDTTAPAKTTTTTTKYGGWVVSCTESGEPAAKTCSAQFRVANKENSGLVLVWVVGRNASGQLLSEFVTPSDIMIKPGVSIALGDAVRGTAEFISCTKSQGCRASIELTPKLTRDLKQATQANVSLTLVNGQTMRIGIDITGIDQTLAELGA